MPIYLMVLVIKGCSFLDGLRQAPKPYSKRGALLYCVGLPDKSGFRWLNFYLSRPARRTNRNTKAATTATIPRAKRMVFIVLLLSGDSMSEYYTMGEFRRARSRLAPTASSTRR